MVNTPASSGVTRMMVEVDEIVAPLTISIRRDWPMTRNSNPETAGSGGARAPLPEVMMVSCADSPNAICDGSIVASTETAAADAGAVATFAGVAETAASNAAPAATA
jgi:hypothetical protein